MTKKIFIFLFMLFIANSSAFAHDYHENFPQKPNFIKQKQMDNVLNERLNLTLEQQIQLKKNRFEHRKQIDKIINKMEILHKEIRNVYYSGIPKFQADVKTAPMKAELVLLKQNADKLRQENRKNFEQILTKEQKVEFEKFKKEIQAKKQKN